MRLLIFTQYFPPETGAPQARLFELGKRLREMGHTVTVLTAMPNYPTGRVFDGYRWQLRRRDVVDGIPVTRTWIYASNSSRSLPRLLCYLSFAVSSVLLGSWGLGRHDVVLVESPPLFLAPAGVLVRWITGGRLVFNVSDIWPDLIVRMGHTTSGPFLRALFWLERFAYRHADVVALTNPGAAGQIRERFPGTAVTVISNGVDTEMFCPQRRSDEMRRQLGAGPHFFLAGYCGLLGLAQGLEVLVAAAERLRDRPEIKLIVVGDGPVREKLRALAREKDVPNLTFLDRRPKSEMPALLASCDVSIVPLSVRLPGTMPSKVYEALAAGTPPLVAKGCEAERLVEEFNAGRAFEPMDGQELADAIRWLADHPEQLERMRANCRQLAQRFSRDVIARRTEGVLRAVASGEALPAVEW